MRKHYRIILILLTVLCVIGAVYTIPFVRIAAVVVFLAPGSEHELGAWRTLFTVLSIPLWFAVGAIGGWVLYVQGWLRTSLDTTSPTGSFFGFDFKTNTPAHRLSKNRQGPGYPV
jgi:hypothetical protein